MRFLKARGWFGGMFAISIAADLVLWCVIPKPIGPPIPWTHTLFWLSLLPMILMLFATIFWVGARDREKGGMPIR